MSPHRRREVRRQQALSSFRNHRIQKIYGAPCPYKRVPTVLNEMRALHPNTSQDRDYCAPITNSHSPPQLHGSAYDRVILGGVRPVSASRLKFNHTEEDESLDSEPLPSTAVHRPRSSSGHASSKSPHQQSPRRLQLTAHAHPQTKTNRNASVRVECSEQEAQSFHYDSLEVGDSEVQEERAILAISSALVDTRKNPASQGHTVTTLDKTGGGEEAGGESSYYEEIAEDTGPDEDVAGGLTHTAPLPSPARYEASGSSDQTRPLSSTVTHHKEHGHEHGAKHHRAHTAEPFRHYPSSRQQRRMADMDPSALRRIVPSYDKNYLRARPPPAKLQTRRRKPPRPGPSGVPEKLSALGLFFYPSSNYNEESDEPEEHRETIEVEVPRYQELKERQRRTFSRKKPPSNQESRDLRSSTATRPSTAGAVPSGGGGGGQQQQRQARAHPSSAGYARRVTSAVSSKRQGVSASSNRAASARGSASKEAAGSKSTPSRKASEGLPSTSDQQQEEEVFEVGMMVQARYKNRDHWWQGKVVARNLPLKRAAEVGFKYDIRYGEVLERNVPPSRMRRRPTVSSRAKLKEIIAKDVMADNLLHGEGFPEYSPDGDAGEEKSREDKNTAPPPLLGSQKLGPERRATVSQKDIMSKLVVVAAMNEGQGIDFSKLKHKSNMFLSDLQAGGLHDDGSFKSPALRKTVTNQKSAADLNREEKEQEEKREKEREEQARLFRELSIVVSDGKKKIAYSDLKFERTIGRGKFASVHQVLYSCKVHCQLSRADRLDRLADSLHILDENSGAQRMDMTLAVKTPEYRDAPALYADPTASAPGSDSDDPPVHALPPSVQLLETIREVRALSELNHPNIINYYGVTLEPRVCVVLELLHCSLADVLSTPAAEAKVALDNPQRLLIVRDICSGLRYMHEQHFAHLDVKPHNILLSVANGGYAAKLADLGTSVKLADGEVLTKPVGTSGYTAPEISMPGRYDFRADIFSFAVVMWEVLVHDGSGRPPAPNPFTGKDLDEAACDAHGGVRPSLEHSRLPQLNDTVSGAWATSPDARLTLGAVLQALHEIEP